MIGVMTAAPPRLCRAISMRRTAGIAMAVLTMTELSGLSYGGAIEQISAGPLSVDERTELRCLPDDAPGPFAEPLAVMPSPERIVSATYSDGQDIVRLAGDEAPIYPILGPGDDFAFLYSAGPGWHIAGGSGADTVFLCSMDDLSVSIRLGTWTGDSDPDVVIIESAVFASVPEGMLRHLVIYEYDPANDRLVIEAPAALLERRQSSIELGGIRIGDVIVRLYTLGDDESLKLGGMEIDSVTFIPTETGASPIAPDFAKPPAQD